MKTRSTSVVIALATLLLPAAAFADGFGTLQAASGSFSPNSAISGASLSFAGSGFSLSTTGPMSFGACGIGVAPDSSGMVSVTQCPSLYFAAGAAQLTIGAASQNIFIDNSNLDANSATMTFLAGAPEVILSELVPISGVLNVCSSLPGAFGDPFGLLCPIPHELMGQVSVTAISTMTIDLVQNPDGTYSKNSVTYTFPIVTPEPATIALLIAGLAAVALWTKRRNRFSAAFALRSRA
jgi:hypothetical protein